MADAALQLGLFDAPAPQAPPAAVEGPMNRPWQLCGWSGEACDAAAAVRCMAERALCDELIALLDDQNRRAENDLREIEQMTARLMGCSVEEMRERVATEKAEEQARRAEAKETRKVSKPIKTKATKTAEVKIGARTLDERQRELLRLVRVESNIAIYTGTERIPDWKALKSVLEALGGSWKTGGKKAPGGFRFPDDLDAAELVRLALETGEILDPKAAELFETPDLLAGEMADFIDPQPGETFLEPSAGRGALARAIRQRCPTAEVVCVEPFEASRLELERQGFPVIAMDFLSMLPEHHFDGIIMNPPFSKRADIRHILHALTFLKPGGRLAAIASSGVMYRADKLGVEFRSLIRRHDGTITENPRGSFLASGTGVNTCMVKLRKAANRG